MTKTPSQPPKDESQDFVLMDQEERDSYTMLSFKRKRDTGDAAGDIVIKVL